MDDPFILDIERVFCLYLLKHEKQTERNYWRTD